MQATSSSDEMGSKAKVADVNDAFGAADTMLIGDVFGKNPKKKTCKATDSPLDVAPKRPRLSSTTVVAPTQLASASALAADASGSRQQQQGKSRFYAEFIRLTNSLVRGQLFGHGSSG